MSELPSGWLSLTLSEVVDIQKGKKPFDLGEKNATRQIPYINIAAFETGYIREYAVEQNIPKCEPKDTLLVWDGARAGLSGRGANGYIGSTLAKISSLYTNPDYLFYFFQSIYKILNTQTKGVGIPHIDPNILKNLKFPLPPLNEQNRIVAKLEELFSDLDAGISELNTAQAKLKQYRQSLLKAAVEGDLSRAWRESRPADAKEETGAQLLERILIERRKRWEEKQLAKFTEQGKQPPKDWQKKYPEPVKPDNTDLPKLPDGWVWASVKQVASDERYSLAIGPFGSNLKVPDYRDSGVPLVFVRNIRSGNYGGEYTKYITQEKAKELHAHNIKAGDVLVTKMGEPPGDADVYPANQPPAVITADCIKIRCESGLMIAEFLKAAINSEIGKRQIRPMTQGVAQKKVSLERFSNLAVPLPPLSEQSSIVQVLSDAEHEASAQLKAIELSLKQSTAQRKNILRAAFAGELVPQDPNDEPASVLLERIQAERAAQTKKSKGHLAKADLLLNASMDFGVQATFNLEYDIQDTSRKDRMTDLESLKKRINELESCHFSAQELLAESGLKYDQFSEFLVQLLSEQVPIIRQFFDKENQKMMLERVRA